MKGVLYLFGVVFTVSHTLEHNPTPNFCVLCVWNKNGQNRVPLKLSSECTYYLHFLLRRAGSHQRNRQRVRLARLETQRPSRHPGSRTPNNNLPLQKTLSQGLPDSTEFKSFGNPGNKHDRLTGSLIH
jgi:hypothetical protein